MPASGSGQVQPDRTTTYNRKYWEAVNSDLGAQYKNLKFPNRNLTTGSPMNMPPAGLGPYTRGFKGKLPPGFTSPRKFLPEK